MKKCKEWLKEYLTGKGIVICEIVREEAHKLGFTRKDLKEARTQLGVETVNDWALQDGGTKNWFWTLPEEEYKK